MNTGVVVSYSYINDFITNVEGIYAQIIVENGPVSGTRLRYKQSNNIKKAETLISNYRIQEIGDGTITIWSMMTRQ
jgi:hypothetical protein